MKIFRTSKTLALVFLLTAAPAFSDSLKPEITLDGLTSIFGDRRALLKMRVAGQETSFMLAEGESAGDIKLLAADLKNGSVKISNNGTVQTIALCQTPLLSTPSSSSGTGSSSEILNFHSAGSDLKMSGANNFPTDNATTANVHANSSGEFFAGAASGSSDGQKSDSSQPAQSAAQNNSTTDSSSSNSSSDSAAGNSSQNSTSQKTPDPWWLIGSKNMERARSATAELVLRGEAEPYPLTPLTPPGTPAALIGEGQLYFGHSTAN